MLAPRLEIKQAVTRYGRMHYYGDDRFVGHALERYGEYSEAEVELWRKIVKPGDFVIDAGANIGAMTLALANIVGENGSVLAIEPQPENFALLERNTESFSNIRAVHTALGNRQGMIKVPQLIELGHKNYGAIELNAGDIEVNLVTLDEICPARPSFIKIDVEGMEAEVLRGAFATIAKYRPVLYVENDRDEKFEELMGLLDTLNYKAYVHEPQLYATKNFNGVPINEQLIYSTNALCIPRECVTYADVVSKMHTPTVPQPDKQIVSNKNWACIVRVGGIGDNLIAASVLRPLKTQGYKIEVITQEPQSVVFENNPYIDKLTVKTPRELPQNDIMEWQKYWWGRSGEFKRFVNLSHSVEALMARFQSDSAFWWPFQFRRKICGQSYLEVAHDIVEVPHDFGPLFFPTEVEKSNIASFRERNGLMEKPLVSWVVGGTRVDKVYSHAGPAIARLLSEMDVNVIMMCAPSPQYRDSTYAEQIMNSIMITNSSTKGLYEARHVEGTHNWPIRRMLTLAQMSELVIGPDSGIMWSVAFEPVPKIVLHSHAGVDNITKHWLNTISLHADQKRVPCSPCHLLHDGVETCQAMQEKAGLKPSKDDLGAACIRDISVQLVVAAAKAALKNDAGVLDKLISDYPGSVTLRKV